MTNYYLGTVSEVVDKLTYEIKVDIDGIVESKPAFPFRGEVDEPIVGDKVILRNIDPLYGSMYLYSKLKEDEFIGFRSNGKSVSITPDYIEVSVYKYSEDNHGDFSNGYTKIKINDSGDLDITVGNGGNLNINVDGDTTIKSDGHVTIDSPKIRLADLKSIPEASGSLNCIAVCPLTGVKHSIDFGIK